MASISSLASLPHAVAVGPLLLWWRLRFGVGRGPPWGRPEGRRTRRSRLRETAHTLLATSPDRPTRWTSRDQVPEVLDAFLARGLAGVRKRPDPSPTAVPAAIDHTSDRGRKIAARSRARSSVPAPDARRALTRPTLTEIPEHLLKRSRERRAALGLPTDGGEGTPAEGGAAEGGASVPAP